MSSASPASDRRARFPWRALLYGTVILYLVADLYWLRGPLRQRIERRKAFTEYSLQQALANGWVATVNREPVTRGQLAQAVAVYLFRRGQTETELSASARQIVRRVALQRLIDDTLIRQYALADKKTFVPDGEAIEKRVKAFESQFADAAEYEARLGALGMTRDDLHAELANLETQSQWLEDRIADATEITEADLREWFEQNAGTDPGTENPPLIRARHLFLSTVEEDTPERETLIREWHRQLTSKEIPFETLAAEFSEDERSRHRGGDLGWFGAARMPPDFADVAFGLRPGEISEPFRSSLGWHIVEVTETRPPGGLDFETLKPEIAAWIETERRRYAIRVLLNRLKTVAVIEVFPDNFEEAD